MSVHVCKLQNNAGFRVRVVIMSRHGQGDYLMQPGANWIMQWAEGDKILIAWDAGTGRLLHFRQIRVVGRAQFVVFKGVKSVAASEAATHTAETAIDQGQTSDSTSFGPADTGQPSG